MKLFGTVTLTAARHDEADGGEPPGSPSMVVTSDHANPSARLQEIFYILHPSEEGCPAGVGRRITHFDRLSVSSQTNYTKKNKSPFRPPFSKGEAIPSLFERDAEIVQPGGVMPT
jgi:hypothetical protein